MYTISLPLALALLDLRCVAKFDMTLRGSCLTCRNSLARVYELLGADRPSAIQLGVQLMDLAPIPR